MSTNSYNPGCSGKVTAMIGAFFLVMSGGALIYRTFNELPANRVYNISSPVLVVILIFSVLLLFYSKGLSKNDTKCPSCQKKDAMVRIELGNTSFSSKSIDGKVKSGYQTRYHYKCNYCGYTSTEYINTVDYE